MPNPAGGATGLCAINFVGNQLERSPENAFVGQFNYTRGFGNTGMEWFVEGNTSFQDERYLDPENTTTFDAYWLTDLRLGLIADKWDALIFVDNVFADGKFLCFKYSKNEPLKSVMTGSSQICSSNTYRLKIFFLLT